MLNSSLINIITEYSKSQKQRIYLVKFTTTSIGHGYHTYTKIEWNGVKVAYSKSEAIEKLSNLVRKFANKRYKTKNHIYNDSDGKLKSEYKNLKSLNEIMKKLTYCGDGDNDEFICDIQLVDLDFNSGNNKMDSEEEE